jgi:DNA-binding HxlR family transcriptional regulator
MRKIHNLLLATVLVAVMLIASTPAIALAQEDETPERRGALIAQVASILGIDQQELEDALKQAQTELRQENLDARLQELIADGTLTQQQANELKAWMNARPDVPNIPPRQLKEALEKGIITQEQVDQLKEWTESRPDIPNIGPTIGERLVEEGIITQQQADEYKAWMESRPADIPKVGPVQLKKLLDEGEITQEQMDAFKAWAEARPDMPEVRPELQRERTENVQERLDLINARAAEILGIDEEDLENAFKQAQSGLREQALDARLQELVNQGTWTQQQADAFKAWIKAKPDVPPLGPARQPGQSAPLR